MTCRVAMLLLLAAIAVVSASAANPQAHVMPIQRYASANVNGKQVLFNPQTIMAMDQAAAASVSAKAGVTQPQADDRSLKLITKGIPLLAFAKWKKKKKKFPKKNIFALPAFLGGAAIAASAASAAATATKGAAAATGPAATIANLLGPGAITAPVPANLELPIWKIHKYNGYEIRPISPGELFPSPVLRPPSELTPLDGFQHVVGQPPSVINIPEPTFVQQPFPTDVVYQQPEPKDTAPPAPAPTYGPPAATYGPPAATYGPPAATYGPPAASYSPPPAPTYGVPASSYPTSQSVSFPSQTDDGNETEGSDNPSAGLEALSTLGALTDYAPGGGDSGSRFPSFLNFGGQGGLFSRFRGPQSAENAESTIVEPVGTVYTPPQQSAIHNLLGRIPLISSLTNFGSNPTTHVTLPPLPEFPGLPDTPNVRGANIQVAQVPHIRLPVRYVYRGRPYTIIRPPQQLPLQPQTLAFNTAASQIDPVVESTTPPQPVAEPAKPETTYPLPLEQPQAQQEYQQQYKSVNSYGQPVQAGYFVTPVVAGPAPPQYPVPLLPNPVYGVPHQNYGPPGDDAAVAASEVDAATVTVAAADCVDGKCADASSAKTPETGVTKVAFPEGQTRAAMKLQPERALGPVYKKEPTKTQNTQGVADDMTTYLEPTHPAAKAKANVHTVEDTPVDASPSTNDEEES